MLGEGGHGVEDVRPLDAVQVRHGQPARFCWRGRWYTVKQSLDSWHEINRWWLGESEMMWWRLESTDRGVWEIGWRPSAATWWLGRIWD